jgi:biotin carboxyl carrier protein
MKMENELRAPKDGVVRAVPAREGTAIERGVVLVVIE